MYQVEGNVVRVSRRAWEQAGLTNTQLWNDSRSGKLRICGRGEDSAIEFDTDKIKYDRLKKLGLKISDESKVSQEKIFVEIDPDVRDFFDTYRKPNGQPLSLEDVLEHTSCASILKSLKEQKDKNELGVIMMTSANENVSGAVFLKNGANDFIAKPFLKEELICRVNNTIENMENINKIANFANKDFLTGLFNRRYFYDDMQEYLASLEENPMPYAVAVIDVDGLKNINDKYGQDSGDKILKLLAKKLIDDTKSSDIAARFGGGEFCVLLKNVSQEDAVKFFVGLRAAIAANPINIKNEPVKISVSIGVTFGKSDYNVDEILELADEALYRAKENGRNRVEIA